MSAQRRKGTAFEREVVEFVAANGFRGVSRAPFAGSNDVGDIIGMWLGSQPVTFECKAANRIELAAWMGELDAEAERAGSKFGFLVVKRRAKPVSQAYAVCSLDTLVALLKEAGAWTAGAVASSER